MKHWRDLKRAAFWLTLVWVGTAAVGHFVLAAPAEAMKWPLYLGAGCAIVWMALDIGS